jgi:hypothetical protein
MSSSGSAARAAGAAFCNIHTLIARLKIHNQQGATV